MSMWRIFSPSRPYPVCPGPDLSWPWPAPRDGLSEKEEASVREIAREVRDEPKPEPKPETFYCSFCAKSQHEVVKLIAGPTVFICSECVVLCVGILADPKTPTPKAAA